VCLAFVQSFFQIDVYNPYAHLVKGSMACVKLAKLPTTIEDVRSKCRSLKHGLEMVEAEVDSHAKCRALELGDHTSLRVYQPSLDLACWPLLLLSASRIPVSRFN
jgi:hypothetical protein